MEDNNRNDQNKKNDDNKKNIQNLIIIMITAFLAVMLIHGLLSKMQESRREEVPYNQFLEWVDAGEVKRCV